MSKNVVCHNCQTPSGDEEICTACFTPLKPLSPLFTVDCTREKAFVTPTRLQRAQGFPDLQSVQFKPTSWLSRTLTRARGGIASSIVALLCVFIGLYFYHGYYLSDAEEAAQQARDSMENRKYSLALQHWDTSIRNYKSIYKTDGQVEALLGKSQCYLKTGNYPEAIIALEMAHKLAPTDELQKEIAKTHRLSAKDALETAEQLYYEEELPQESLERAQFALQEFGKGQANDTFKADAERLIAVSSAAVRDFEAADSHLDKAVALDGKSPKNDEASEEIAKQYKDYQREKVASAKRSRYIPEGELDLSQLAKERPEDAYRPKERRRYSSAKTYSNYRRTSSYSRRTRTKTNLAVQPDYPTKTRRTSYNRNRYRYNRNRYNSVYNNYSSYSRPTKSTVQQKPSYPTATKRRTSTYSKYSKNRYKSSTVRSTSVRYKSPTVRIPGR